MTPWTFEDVERRFHDAAVTAHRLPPARVAGYVSVWPEIARQSWEGYADDLTILRVAATPAAVDRMVETTRWLQWLDTGQRKLVWARARYVPWRIICTHLHVPRQTAWRHWRHALTVIVIQLNGSPPRIVVQTAQARSGAQSSATGSTDA